MIQYESCRFQCDSKYPPFLSGIINSMIINNTSLKSKITSFSSTTSNKKKQKILFSNLIFQNIQGQQEKQLHLPN